MNIFFSIRHLDHRPVLCIFSVSVSDCVLKLWHKNNWNNHWAPVIDRCCLCDKQARVKFGYVSK